MYTHVEPSTYIDGSRQELILRHDHITNSYKDIPLTQVFSQPVHVQSQIRSHRSSGTVARLTIITMETLPANGIWMTMYQRIGKIKTRLN
jgi:hypothetical protein